MTSLSYTKQSLWQLFDITKTNNEARLLEADLWAYRIPKWYTIQAGSLKAIPNSLRESAELLVGLKDTTEEAAFEEAFANFIYSSNAIEQVGLDKSQTWKLVREVLGGYKTDSDEEWMATKSKVCKDSMTRREVVQHVHAFIFLKSYLGRHGNLSKEGLLECHKILTDGIPSEDGDSDYQGVYRQCEMSVGDPLKNRYGEEKKVAVGADVASLMRVWIEDFNQALASTHDPIAAGSNLKIRFLDVHPFLDGNGRLSRMLFNALVTAYLPHTIVTFSENKRERIKYLQSVREALRTNSPGIFAFFALKRASKASLKRLQSAEAKLKRQDGGESCGANEDSYEKAGSNIEEENSPSEEKAFNAVYTLRQLKAKLSLVK
ncbi:hypothetical protein Dda_7406 [Drechslerella dactyloides]|uniref:Fido domain-containing protein n=1 Tax=Drechslerella dactyloides TaxID=74499 RepID=A0AAD6NGR1_DREDA|nr:hypothetical protein Dda_7406 [Drechslerella dactyloides]